MQYHHTNHHTIPSFLNVKPGSIRNALTKTIASQTYERRITFTLQFLKKFFQRGTKSDSGKLEKYRLRRHYWYKKNRHLTLQIFESTSNCNRKNFVTLAQAHHAAKFESRLDLQTKTLHANILKIVVKRVQKNWPPSLAACFFFY